MGKFLKKNWFICLLVVALAGVSVYYIYETNKGKLKGKKDSGKDVIYEIDNTDKTADDFYTDLFRSNGPSALYSSFSRAVADQAYKTTDEMKETARTQAQNIIQGYAGQYGTSYKDQIDEQLKSAGYENGYDDLEKYLVDYQKIQQIEVDYAKANFDDLKIRDISYILIQNKDPNASSSSSSSSSSDDDTARTDEEIEALKKKVDDSLAAGTSFADTAIAYSEDSSSAKYGGVLGIIDTNTESSLDADFYKAAMELKEGEVSDWVHSDTFGWFKIKCDSASADTIADVYAKQQDFRTSVDKEAADEAAKASASPDASASADATAVPSASPSASASAEATASATPTAAEEKEKENAPYLALASNYDNKIGSQSLWAKAEELGLEFSDDSTRTALRVVMGLDDEDDASATASPEASAEASSSAEATASAEAN